ncbi:MAG: PLP-dependent transferase, partial [Christiangramia sp.]|nr:PLP-dependent transferase [Christiangramia sp.]
MENFETIAVRTQTERTQFLEHSTPLYLTSSYVFEDSEDMRASFAEEKERNIYSRFTNPNTSEFVEKIAKMEGAETGYAFATGMSAVFSTLATLLDSGDHIISARAVFGSTHSLFTKFFPKWNISHSYFNVNEVDKIESLIKPETKVIFAET